MFVLTKKEITLHLVGLAMVIILAGWWYWQSTGVRAVPALIEQLHAADPSARIVAADWLGSIGPPASAAVPSLEDIAMQDAVQHANTTAAGALRHIDLAAARRVMTHYLSFLDAKDVQQRRTACAVIGALGPVAKPAVSSLIVVMHDPDDLVRRNALAALGTIGIPPDDIARSLYEGLADQSALVRQAAAMQFAFTVPLPRQHLDEIAAMLDRQDAASSSLLRSALEKSRPDEAPQVETLVQMIGPSAGREHALHQLARFGPSAASATSKLIPVLQDGQPLHRYLAVETLRAIGAAGPQIQEALTPLLHDPDTIVRESVAELLADLDHRAPVSRQDRTESSAVKP